MTVKKTTERQRNIELKEEYEAHLGTTTIQLRRTTKERLVNAGKKNETYDDVILRLLELEDDVRHG